jgi:hypothetical protein
MEVKMRRVFLAMAVCCLVAGPALADGGVDLFGTYGEVIEGENSGGLGVRVSLGGTNLLFDFTATWYKEINDIAVIDDPAVADDDFQIFPLDFGLRYLFSDGKKVRPYLGGGVSYVVADANRLAVDDGFGLYALGGLRVGRQQGINFMVELLYRWAEVTVEYGQGLDDDVTLGGFGASAGIALVF